MGTNPNTPQGALNRIRGSIVIPAFPELNVTASFLGREGIAIRFQGETTLYIPTMTGAVTSPEPYQMVEIDVALLKTQNLAQAYEAQRQLLSLLGDLTIRPDAATLAPYQVINASIANVAALKFNGEEAIYPVLLKGYININSSLWNG